MTILDYDKREKTCPVCNAARLIFITDAPKIRPVGKSVQYRCRDCAITEATAAGDPIEVIRHCERRHVPPAWNSNRRPQPKVPITAQKFSKGTRRPTLYSDFDTKAMSEHVLDLIAQETVAHVAGEVKP